MATKKYVGVLTTRNMNRIRNAWRNGRRSITIADECLTLHRAENPAFILAIGEYGTVAQIETQSARKRREANSCRHFTPVTGSELEYRLRNW